jgi:hypothetical protein
MRRRYVYAPRLARVRDVRTLWVAPPGEGLCWLSKGFAPPPADARGVGLTRDQGAWVLRTWRRKVRSEGGTLRREEGQG